jgi:hypothetical protein
MGLSSAALEQSPPLCRTVLTGAHEFGDLVCELRRVALESVRVLSPGALCILQAPGPHTWSGLYWGTAIAASEWRGTGRRLALVCEDRISANFGHAVRSVASIWSLEVGVFNDEASALAWLGRL